ncbi:2-amino-4-hydroxy-6-hydroxymethyldihydropteridine diphosphokinase [Pigmentibacter sp. JX0631]|uniref:2-amino-4-hydroxy-6- hydroxymethyldihydropteridine diphosphokinase n=1 Tax=Pigmentibacter sp. JX0631 TaxID=2976982 RepID=UPI0024697507|nr:2-amino-4-hydroxy-6-hydroxymethyldihydropteridine diphosphokinase [Pigmentibacter sp. JX0631]WGL58804.1 2-amino-4-hydroxy-6-hydroxymethyldihydropteridine diphosphokinase [Pigmentibacter sp. JX0631]
MQKKKYHYILAFGSNLGDRIDNLSKSLKLLEKHVTVLEQSRWRETLPLTHPVYNTDNHEFYINFVAHVETSLNPIELYRVIIEIEDIIGHPRERRWMPRALDIDILFCAHSSNSLPFCSLKPCIYYKSPDFHVPHTEYFKRDFWQDMVENEMQISKETILKHFNLL